MYKPGYSWWNKAQGSLKGRELTKNLNFIRRDHGLTDEGDVPSRQPKMIDDINPTLCI